MKDFDERRRERLGQDRHFKLGGEDFVAKASIAPETLAAFDDVDLETTTPLDIVKASDRFIEESIEGGDEAVAKYRAIRADRDDAITAQDLRDVITWMLGIQTGRPTGQPADSSGSRGSTGTTSTDASDSPVPVAA